MTADELPRLRLRPGVMVTPLADGLHVRGRRGHVTLEGSRALPGLWKVLEPALRTGDFTHPVWREPPTAPVRTALAALVGQLRAHDALMAAADNAPEWLAATAEDPAAADAALASARPRVMARDPDHPLAQAAARALARAGTTPVLAADPELPSDHVVLSSAALAVAAGTTADGTTAFATAPGSQPQVRAAATALTRRLTTDPEHPAPPVAFVAAAAVHRLLCALAGLPDPAEEGDDPHVLPGRPAVLLADGSPLRAAYHAWPDGGAPMDPPGTLDEALRRIAAVGDERVGVLAAPSPGALPQLPAALASCETEGGTLIAAAPRADLARLDAFCRAAELRLAVPVGVTPGHARGRALRRAAARMPVWDTAVEPAARWSRHAQARHWWTTLTVRQGVPARLTVQRALPDPAFGAFRVFRATVRDGSGRLVSEAVEATAGDAVAFAVLGAVAHAQCAAAASAPYEISTPSGASAVLASAGTELAGWEGAGWTSRRLAGLATREPALLTALTRLTAAEPPALLPPQAAPLAAALRTHGFTVLAAEPAESPESPEPAPPPPPTSGAPTAVDPAPTAHAPTPPPPPPPLPLPVIDAHAALLSGAPRTAVVLMEEWTLGLAREVSRYAAARDVRWVPVRVDGGLVVAGPVLGAGAGACLACTEYQRLATAGGRVPYRSGELVLGGVIPPAFTEAVGALAAGLLEAGRETGSAEVRMLHIGRGTWSVHRVRPVGGCGVCRPLPPDTAQAAALPDGPRPLPDPFVLRGPNHRTGAGQLRAGLFDERFGPVRRLMRSEQAVFALSSAYVTDGRLLDDGGYGRADDFVQSERIALFEAVERLAGMRPMGRATVLRAPYAELGPERALDPERLGLPDPAYHGHPAARTVPYHARLPLDWVHGWSLTHRRPVAVPEHVAYWDVPDPDHARVVYESSNGCGLGNSPQEATLYGLFEVAERDAFLMAWYAATPLRTVLPPADDPLVAHLTDRAELAGYRLTLLDATNDFGVPAVVALCRHRSQRTAAPRAFLAAGAHHDPRAAIRGAVTEVVTNVCDAAHRVLAPGRRRDPERLRPMLQRPELVVTLDDHVGLNTLPEALPRLDALVADAPPLDWRAAWPGAPEPVADLTALLTATVGRLARTGLEVVAVRQDEPGIRDRLGLHCVKVVVPGALPMTFGHVNHRTRGLPRLLEVPYRLGRAPRPPHYDELAIHPHPFP